jgi:lysophospholipase L1-like esterase
MAEYQHIVALGSSFAAGPGIDPLVDRTAMRSGRNYPHLLAARLGAALTDLTVSGATTGTILDQPQRARPGRTFPPQAQGIPADADLVTVTAGGNDLGYAAGMLRAAWAGWLRSRPLTRPLGSALGRAAPPPATEAAVEGAASGLVRVVETARARAPRARVVLVDYLTVLGPDTRTGPAVPLSADEITAFRRVADRLAQAFATAARRTGADLLQASALSADHALGSAEPWVTAFRPSPRHVPFHPCAEGMRAVADALYRLVTA